jgi:excisionase family DNA binding protein
LELKCFTPEEAAPYLGKTANWIAEAIRDGRIPFTTVGRSPRLTAAHIRWIQASGERVPNRYAKPLSKQPARAAA